MDEFKPVPFYCEENTWMLLDSETTAEKDFHAILISNETKCVVIFNQNSETGEDIVFWDYHVVALERNGGGSQIWDFNSKLGAPCDAGEWLTVSFRDNQMPANYRPHFRVVPRDVYLSTFASDRSHMRNSDGTFKKSPPPWECIGSGKNNLSQYIDMKSETTGKVYDYYGLAEFIDACDMKS